MANVAFPSNPTLLDDFNRANGAWGANWTVLAGTSAIVANQAKASAVGFFAYWNPTTFLADQEVYCDLVTKNSVTAGAGFGFFVRTDVVAGNGYWVFFDTNANTVSFARDDANVFTAIGSPASVTLANGDRAGMRMVGNRLSAWVNGVEVNSTTSGTYTAGGRLMLTLGDTTTVLDNFSGGNYQAATWPPVLGAAGAIQRAARI